MHLEAGEHVNTRRKSLLLVLAFMVVGLIAVSLVAPVGTVEMAVWWIQVAIWPSSS
jgi:nitrate reductase NapE component